jgi:hypothetical protein
VGAPSSTPKIAATTAPTTSIGQNGTSKPVNGEAANANVYEPIAKKAA